MPAAPINSVRQALEHPVARARGMRVEIGGIPLVGSPMFMSPQVLGNQKYTKKCDIWSLGIIFYCMIFRNSPYGDTSNPKIIL